MTAWFELTDQDGVARLELARPAELNTLSIAMMRALREALEQLDEVGRTRVLVVSSTGKHFSAGMRLEEFAEQSDVLSVDTPRSRLAFAGVLRDLMACFDVFDRVRFPVIAAIQGGCIGGAVDLVAACDMRFCTRNAFFSIEEINVGLVADLGTLQRLPKLIPAAVVREYAYSGRRMPAERAHAVGLVNDVYPDVETMRTGIDALAREIAAKSPLAVAGTKLALNHARDHSTAEALDRMAILQSAIFSPDEIAASVRAAHEKRSADFADLARAAQTSDPRR